MRNDRNREALRRQLDDLRDVEMEPVGPPLWAILVLVMGVVVLLCGIVTVVVTVTNDGPVHGRIVVVTDSSQPATSG